MVPPDVLVGPALDGHADQRVPLRIGQGLQGRDGLAQVAADHRAACTSVGAATSLVERGCRGGAPRCDGGRSSSWRRSCAASGLVLRLLARPQRPQRTDERLLHDVLGLVGALAQATPRGPHQGVAVSARQLGEAVLLAGLMPR